MISSWKHNKTEYYSLSNVQGQSEISRDTQVGVNRSEHFSLHLLLTTKGHILIAINREMVKNIKFLTINIYKELKWSNHRHPGEGMTVTLHTLEAEETWPVP